MPFGAVATALTVLWSFAARADDIVVVLVGSTSALSQLHEPVDATADSMLAALNEQGGLFGRRVRIVVEDDGCDTRHAVKVATEIAALRPAVIVGHSCAAAAVAAAAIYRATGLMMIATGVHHPALTPARKPDLVFRLAGRDDRQAAAIAATVKQHYGGRRVAIVRDQSHQGRQLALAVERETARMGDKPSAVVAYTAGDKDHGPATAKIAASAADVIVFTGQATEAAIIRGELRALGRQVHAIGSDVMAADHRLLAPLGGEAPVLVMLPWPVQTSRGDDAPMTRAALEAWIAAAQHAGSVEGTRVGEALRAVPHSTSLGPIRFDSNGDAEVPSHVPANWSTDGWRPLTLSAK